VLAIDAEGERRRRLQARCHRDVHVVDELDGISVLIARMATEDAHAVMKQLDACAHASDSNVTIGEKRAEALAALVLGGDGATAAPSAPTWTSSSTCRHCSASRRAPWVPPAPRARRPRRGRRRSAERAR